MSAARCSPTRTLAAAVLAAATLLAAAGHSTADETPPASIECPPDLGIDEPIGPCGRDGNGPGPEWVDDPDEAIDHEDPPPFVVECPYEVPDHAGAAISADPPIVVRAAGPVPYMDRSLPYTG